MFDIPEGYELNLKGRGDQWTARLNPDGHSASKWSQRSVEAKARTAEEALRRVIAKCPVA